MSTPPPATTTHRLSGGMVVSGPLPDKPRTKASATTSAAAAPYTGGDIKRSGDLGRMFDLSSDPAAAAAVSSSPTLHYPHHHYPRTHSGPLSRSLTGSKTKSSSSSGPLSLPATGLITSGPPSASSSARRSGGAAASEEHGTPRKPRKGKGHYGPAVTVLGRGERHHEYAVSTAVVITGALVLVVLVTLGVFLLAAVKSMAVLAAAGGIVAAVVALGLWNWGWSERGLEAFLRGFPDADLHNARDGQFVKVTGIVTCGSIPLETSYQGLPRCVYVATELYEYRGWNGKLANPDHKRLTWGLKHTERYVADFYISDSRRGIRALVKAGHGTKVISFVRPTNMFKINKRNKEMYPTLTDWLNSCSLSYEDQTMRLEEGYIKEGSTTTVMGILQKHDNILMIVPPEEPISTGCIWRRLLLSMHVKGLVLMGDETPNDDDVITV